MHDIIIKNNKLSFTAKMLKFTGLISNVLASQ
jgi:hypothetical protein